MFKMLLVAILLSLLSLGQVSEAKVTVVCPGGWTPYPPASKCFKAINTTKHPTKSQSYFWEACTLEGLDVKPEYLRTKGKLASICGNDEMNAVKQVANAAFGSVSYWIGKFKDKEGQWRWTDGSDSATPIPCEYTNWEPGQPDNWHNRQRCVRMQLDNNLNGQWDDSDCANSSIPAAVCQIPAIVSDDGSGPPAEGPCNKSLIKREGFEYFIRQPPPGGFWAAEEDCKKCGGHLPSIHSQPEAAFINENYVQKFAVNNYLWSGLFGPQGGTTSRAPWNNTDGSEYKGVQGLDTFWQDGQPDNFQGVEWCAAYQKDKVGMWDDIPCQVSFPYSLCKRPVTHGK